jgi:cytochrome c553
MNHRLASVVVSLLAWSLCGAAAAAGDPAAGQQKSQLCAACHGADGNSVNPDWPNLAGQSAEYIRKQLFDFREQRRKNDQMAPMVATLTDQDIDDIAAWYTSQKPKLGAADPAKDLDVGERLYRAGNAASGVPACMACHGPDGSGNPAAVYAAVAGQHAKYTATQLMAFKSEVRANDLNSVMRAIAARMTNKDIEAVANYIQGLH